MWGFFMHPFAFSNLYSASIIYTEFKCASLLGRWSFHYSLFLGEGITTLVTNSVAKVRNFFELAKSLGKF